VDEVIELVGLGEKRDARVKTLSGGQKRRLDLGVALVGDPDLVFLDEPTTGFDPSARRTAWDLVRSLRSLGKTILLTTHYLDEAQQLADAGSSARGSSMGRRTMIGPPMVRSAIARTGAMSRETDEPTRVLAEPTAAAVAEAASSRRSRCDA
jgi:ABC-2 type transport system ATP-binding protein